MFVRLYSITEALKTYFNLLVLVRCVIIGTVVVSNEQQV